MLTDKEKSERLRMCIALLHDVDAMQQTALGDSDVCYANHNKLQELIEDFEADVQDLDARAEGTVL
jgi:hypothetical protein